MASLSKGREQIFPYSMKTIAVTDRGTEVLGVQGYGTSKNILGLQMINPQNFYQIEDLSFHLRFKHNGVTAGRNIISIGVTDSMTSPTFSRSLNLNIAPVSMVVELSKDLGFMRNINGTNIVVVTFDDHITGIIEVFKVDVLYTMIGLR